MKHKAKILCVTTILSLIIVTIIASTLYTIDWQLKHAETFKRLLVNEGKDLINVVLSNKNFSRKLAKSNILSLSPEAFMLSQYLPSLWKIVVYRDVLRELVYPNLFLTICSSFNASCAIIYKDTDVKQINPTTILWYFLNLSKTLKAGNFKISFLPYMMPPSFKSNVCLVFKDFDDNIKFISSALSLLGINYTYTYYLDINSLQDCDWLILPSEGVLTNIYEMLNLSSVNDLPSNIIILNLNGSYDLLRGISLNNTAIRISSNYPVQAIVNNIPTHNGTITATSSPVDIRIRVIDDDPKALVILDENLSKWQVRGIGYGYGNISEPTLTLSSRSVSGVTPVVIKVGKGSYYQWQIERTFKGLNVTEYNYLTLYWYGRGDRKEYVVELHTSSGSLWYDFIDNWLGWRKVYLPLKLPDGKYNINNVTVIKVTIGKPNLAHVIKIEFRNSAHNLNLSGIFMIDRVAFEHALKLYFEYYLSSRIAGVMLVTRANRMINQEVLLSVNDNKSLSSAIGNITLKISYCHGCSIRAVAKLKLAMTQPIAKIKIDIYPLVKAKFDINMKPRNLTLVLGPDIPKGHVIKYLDLEQRVPFVIYLRKGLYFVNIFPLSELYRRGDINTKEYTWTMKNAFNYIDVPRGDRNISINKDFVSVYKVVFKSLRTSGDITVKPLSGSIIIFSYNNSISQDLRPVVIIVKNNKPLIKATSLTIIGRYGYYALVRVHNATLISEHPLKLVMLGKRNNTKIIEIKSDTIRLGNAQLLLRGFRLEVNGDTDFVYINTFRDLYARFRLRNENVIVHGYVETSLSIFDKYIAGTELQISGKIKRETPIKRSYEVDLDFLLHILIPSILIATFITFIRKRKMLYL